MSGTFQIEIPERDAKGRDLRNLLFTWRVESMPGGHVMVKKQEAKESMTIAADPGMYCWSAVHKDRLAKHLNAKFYGTVYHQVTEEQWKTLANVRPKVAKPMHTRRGVVWHCQFIGCRDTHTSRLAAACHEAKHQGIDLFAEPERVVEAQSSVEVVAEAIKDAKKNKGWRPRKNPLDG